jgi:hypothetical protein
MSPSGSAKRPSTHGPAKDRKARRQPLYSSIAIEAALTLRLVFHLALRQAEGFLGSILKLMGLDLPCPDHTTLSRRNRTVHVRRHLDRLPEGPVCLIFWLRWTRDLNRFVGDGIYDQEPVYGAVDQHSPGVTMIIPPRKDAVLSGEVATSPTQRGIHIEAAQNEGRFQ